MESKSISKVLDFLKENPNLDLEISDIAFNLKRSEKSVETALKKLLEKGLVTSRKSEEDRVYWYALPSAPITKTIKIENTSIPTPTSNISTAASSESKEEIEKETIPDLRSELEKIKNTQNKKAISSAEDESQVKQKDLSFEKDRTQMEDGKTKKQIGISSLKSVSSKISLPHLVIGIFLAVLLVFLLNIIILIKFASVSKNINIIKSVLSKEIVTSSDLNKVVKDFTEKIGSVEEKVSILNSQVDSLRNQIQKKEIDLVKSSKKSKLKKRK